MTLDASAFPHILDAVFDFASHATLLALRTVSQDLCTRVDARLFRHIVVDALSSENHGPRTIVLLTPCGERLPAPPLPSLPRLDLTTQASLRGLLRNTRVVSLRTLSLCAANALPTLLPQLETVHRYTPQPWDSRLLKAATYVDHVDLIAPLSHAGCMPLGDVPSDLERLILRFTFIHPSPPLESIHNLVLNLDMMAPPPVPEILAVAEPDAMGTLSAQQVEQFLVIIARNLAKGSPKVLTFAAFEDLPHQLEGDGPETPSTEAWGGRGMSLDLRETLHKTAAQGVEQSRAENLYLEILSRGEWEAREYIDVLAG